MDKLIESRRAMQERHGDKYEEEIGRFKVFVLAQMSRSRCDEIAAARLLIERLQAESRLLPETQAMLESAALELAPQNPKRPRRQN